MSVVETFFSVEVDDMARATKFYVQVFGAGVTFTSPQWSSLSIAGVRLGLFLNGGHARQHLGLHFAVSDLAATLEALTRAGGQVVAPAVEVAAGVTTTDVMDTEGNGFTLRQA